jgi:hypothetical protein
MVNNTFTLDFTTREKILSFAMYLLQFKPKNLEQNLKLCGWRRERGIIVPCVECLVSDCHCDECEFEIYRVNPADYPADAEAMTVALLFYDGLGLEY